jgi:hypothetical protein
MVTGASASTFDTVGSFGASAGIFAGVLSIAGVLTATADVGAFDAAGFFAPASGLTGRVLVSCSMSSIEAGCLAASAGADGCRTVMSAAAPTTQPPTSSIAVAAEPGVRRRCAELPFAALFDRDWRFAFLSRADIFFSEIRCSF